MLTYNSTENHDNSETFTSKLEKFHNLMHVPFSFIDDKRNEVFSSGLDEYDSCFQLRNARFQSKQEMIDWCFEECFDEDVDKFKELICTPEIIFLILPGIQFDQIQFLCILGPLNFDSKSDSITVYPNNNHGNAIPLTFSYSHLLSFIDTFLWKPILKEFQPKKRDDISKYIEEINDLRIDVNNMKYKQRKAFEKEESLRLILDNSRDYILNILPNGNILFVNHSSQELFNNSHEDLVGESFYDFVHPEDICIVQSEFAQIMSSPHQIKFKHRIISRSGIKWVSWVASAVFDHVKELIFVICVGRDITEQIIAENALIESEAKFKTIFETSPLGIVAFSRKGDVLSTNITFNNLFLRGDVVGLEHFSEANWNFPKSFNIEHETLEDIYSEKRPSYQAIKKYFKKDGSWIWTSFSIKKITVSSSNTFLFYVGIFEDLTETKLIIEALKENEVKFRTVADFTAAWEIWIGKEDKLIYNSPSCEHISGYSSQSFFRHHDLFYEIIFSEDKERVLKHKTFSASPENPRQMTYRIVSKSGSIKWVDHVFQPVYSPNKEFLGVRISVRDITEQKTAELALKEKNRILLETEEKLRGMNQEIALRNEQLLIAKQKAESADKLKTTFLANMSHEIRTPLNGIIGFSDLLAMPDVEPDEKVEFASIIKSNTTQLLTLVNDIVDLSKIEAGQLQIKKSWCDINQIITELQSTFENEMVIREKASLTLESFKELDKLVIYSDRVRINQIFVNLLTNAIKFTASGGIKFGYEKPKDGKVRFFVFDTGCGVPEEKRQIVFERFRQAQETLERDFGGAGLGLSIVKGILDLLGGDIWIESEEGKGSKFFFELPYNEKEEGTGGKKNKKSVLEGKSLLIIDESDEIIAQLTKFLKPLKTNLIFSKTGNEALSLLAGNNKIDAVLTVLDIKDMDWEQFLLKKNKLGNDIPTVGMVNDAKENDPRTKNDISFLISKPFIKESFVEQLSKIKFK